jgi:hypothetical protein
MAVAWKDFWLNGWGAAATKIDSLTEDWSGGVNATKWPSANGSVVGGAYALTGSTGLLRSQQIYQLTDSAVLAKLDITGLTGGVVAVRMRYNTSVTATDRFQFFLSDTTWFASELQANVLVGTETSGSWNPATDQWWRIRHVTGTGVLFEKSSDSQTWTTLKTIASPTIDVSSTIGAVDFVTAGSNTATGNYLIDNINLAVAAPTAQIVMMV